MQKKIVPISEVVSWPKNPRNITKKGFQRLKNQIKWAKDFIPKTKEEANVKYSMLKPLLVYPEGNKFVTLGGNFRLRALEELGETEVEIKITHPKTEADKIRLALIDNDRAGETDDQKQAELIFPYVKEINLEDYNIDRGESTKLSKMMEDYVPGEVEEQKRLEAIAQKEQVKCPECGCEFIP